MWICVRDKVTPKKKNYAHKIENRINFWFCIVFVSIPVTLFAEKLNWKIGIQQAGNTLPSWCLSGWTGKAFKSCNCSRWSWDKLSTKSDLQFYKSHEVVKSERYETYFVFEYVSRASSMATRSVLVECRRVGLKLCYFEQNMILISRQIKPRILQSKEVSHCFYFC